MCDGSVVRSYYTHTGKNPRVVKTPHNFVIIMKAYMSVLLIASSESFPDRASNMSHYNNHVRIPVDLGWYL